MASSVAAVLCLQQLYLHLRSCEILKPGVASGLESCHWLGIVANLSPDPLVTPSKRDKISSAGGGEEHVVSWRADIFSRD
jgi:hypothetical protein